MIHCGICGCRGAHGCLGMKHWGECPHRSGGECICGFDERNAALTAGDFGKLTEITERCESPLLDRYCAACRGSGQIGGGQRSGKSADGVTLHWYEPPRRCAECGGSGMVGRDGEASANPQ